MLLFGLLAWLGWRRSAAWLALGWAAHIVWDLGLRVGAAAPAFANRWYAIVCIAFDLLVAGYLLAGARRTSPTLPDGVPQ